MKLRTSLNHFAGMKLSLDGEIYEVGKDLTLEVPEESGKKLLQSKNWVDVNARSPVLGKKEGVSSKKRISPIITDRKGSPVKIPEPEVVPEPEPEIDPEVQRLLDEEAQEGPADPEGNPLEEWPDVDAEMPIEYLRQVADAYELEYKEGTRAKTLVKKISEAMYPHEG